MSPKHDVNLPDAALTEQQFLQLRAADKAAWVRRGGRLPASLAERLHILVMLIRPRSAVPSLLAFALGYSYTQGSSALRCFIGAVLACCIGFAANLHHAIVQLESNSQHLPRRTLLIAKLGQRQIRSVWGLLLAAMMIAALWLGLYFSIFMALALLGLQSSTPPARGKGRPILGLWLYAQSAVFPFLFGWTTAPGDMLETLWAAMVSALTGHGAPAREASLQSFRYLGMWMFVTLLFMAKAAIKNVSDMDTAAAAGVRSSATVCSSHARAASVATLVTVLAYASLSVLCVLGLAPLRALIALLWLGPVVINCRRFPRGPDAKLASAVLRMDTRLSAGFLGTLTVLIAPTLVSAVAVAVTALLLLWTDVLGFSWLREVDLSERDILDAQGIAHEVSSAIVPEAGASSRTLPTPLANQ